MEWKIMWARYDLPSMRWYFIEGRNWRFLHVMESFICIALRSSEEEIWKAAASAPQRQDNRNSKSWRIKQVNRAFEYFMNYIGSGPKSMAYKLSDSLELSSPLEFWYLLEQFIDVFYRQNKELIWPKTPSKVLLVSNSLFIWIKFKQKKKSATTGHVVVIYRVKWCTLNLDVQFYL